MRKTITTILVTNTNTTDGKSIILLVYFVYYSITMKVTMNQGAFAQNQDKGLSRDIPVILEEFRLALVAQKQRHLS